VASRILPQPVPLGKTGALVLWGFGIKCNVDGGHFCAEWGAGLERYQTRLSRVEGRKLRRVILISSNGYISFEAHQFIVDVGASFSMIDKRGKAIMVCSPVAPSDSKLHRTQSLALGNGTALRISKWLIDRKLQAQAALVRDMLHNFYASIAIDIFRAKLPSAESISSVRLIESQAAHCYWGAWANVPIRWPRKDERRIPAHWKVFGSRISPLTHAPRLAANPPNALLNVLYCLLENECRIATTAMGMDSSIGFLHVDAPNRSSLACDLQEPVRASVDAFLLNWLQSEPLRKADFWEDRNGNCRIATPLVLKLCPTADTWRKLVSPVAEWVAQELWASRATKGERMLLATRLTQRHKRLVKGSDVPQVNHPNPEHGCANCGARIRRNRRLCIKCAPPAAIKNFRVGRTMAQKPEAIAKRASTMRHHRSSIKAWNPSVLPTWLTRDVYVKQIQPALANVTKSRIRSALGVSEPYSSDIRAGKRIPHARHWHTLAKVVGVVEDGNKGH
jgi:CRISPR-associated endonuclease Cas1